MSKKYKFGFVLTVKLGNSVRFRILKKYTERDKQVTAYWAPIDYEPEQSIFVRIVNRLPGFLRWRMIVLYQSMPVLAHLRKLDAVMVHQFEPSILLSMRRIVFARPVLVNSTDDVPLVEGRRHALYANEISRPRWLQRLRLKMDIWRVNRADLTIPMSRANGEVLVNDCGLHVDSVHAMHVGLDLENWPAEERREINKALVKKILFVGGDFERKGGNLLLQAHQRDFAEKAELHIVTMTAPTLDCHNVFVYSDLRPNDARLKRLYAECDLFVLPTYSDLSPWVVLEAMASCRPVISTRVGGIADLVKEGDTGLLVESGNLEALSSAIRKLLDDPSRCRDMGAKGRRVVEQEFNAEINVAKILTLMKVCADESS